MGRQSTAFTEYPLQNSQGVIAVDLLAYDRNKYVTVGVGSATEEVKAGYLFCDEALKKRVSDRQLYALPQKLGGASPTRLEVHKELKAIRRRHVTLYIVWVGNSRCEYRSLHAALRHFGRMCQKEDCEVMRQRFRKFSSVSDSIITSEGGSLVVPVYGPQHKTAFRSRHARIGGF